MGNSLLRVKKFSIVFYFSEIELSDLLDEFDLERERERESNFALLLVFSLRLGLTGGIGLFGESGGFMDDESENGLF
jgi:hypothetical protein